MRVGIAITSLHGGGAELVARRWATGLAARGHTAFAYVYEPGGTGGRKDPALHLTSDVTVRAFEASGRLARVTGLPGWLRRTATEDQLDVLVSMLTYTNLAALSGWRLHHAPPCPLIISERNAPSAYLPLRGRSGRAQVAAARLAYRSADAVIAVSHPVAGDLVGGYGVRPERCFVVPNPVLDRSAPTPTPTPAAQQAKQPGLTVAFAGRLVPQKQPLRFVDALAALARRSKVGPVRGVVIGDGPLEPPMRQAAAAAGVAIEFAGWQEPWPDAARAAGADVLLLPSAVEGFGNVLVEAAAAGLPSVAASTALGVADAIVPGLTGQLALSSSPDDLADAILRAASIDVSGPQIENWLRRFSVESSLDALERTLDLTLRRGAP